MTARANSSPSPEATRLSAIYDEALPVVYRYLRARCGSTALAQELTSATFLQAADAWARGTCPNLTIAWLTTVARHKLIDHWRHQAVVDRSMTVLQGGQAEPDDPWNAVLDQARSADVLHALPSHYRAALTLRYLDDLSVAECAELLDRTVHATESLLVRARNAFRTAYEETGGRHD